MIRKFKGKKPFIDSSAIVDETALIMGNVVVKENVTIWPHAMIRADEAQVVIGRNASIMDKAFIEASQDTIIGERAIISHGAIVHGSIIGDDVLVGIGAIVLEVKVGKGSIIAAGSVVREDVEDETMVAGIPARKIRRVGKREREEMERMRREIAEKARYLKK